MNSLLIRYAFSNTTLFRSIVDTITNNLKYNHNNKVKIYRDNDSCFSQRVCFNNNKSVQLSNNFRYYTATTEGAAISIQNIKQQVKSLKKKMPKLTEDKRNELLQPLLTNGWSMVSSRDAIYKEYLFRDFNKAFSFMTGIALLAEKMDHHPEWFNVYNKVQVTLSSHDVGGLSERDIRMAKYMEEQAKHFS